MWYVYILKSAKKRWYYVGSTNDIARRLKEHNSGITISTKGYSPLNCIFTRSFNSEGEARSYEKKLKCKRRAKEEIIREIEK